MMLQVGLSVTVVFENILTRSFSGGWMKIAGTMLRGAGGILSWLMIGILFLATYQLSWDNGSATGVAAGQAANATAQEDGTGDADGGDDDQDGGDTDDQDDTEDGDSGDEPDEDDGAAEEDDSDDSGDDGDNDGEGGDGEDALDNLSDDADSDDDSEPDDMLGICSESMSMQKKMSVDGLCSTSAGAVIRNRLGFIGELKPLLAETAAGVTELESDTAAKERGFSVPQEEGHDHEQQSTTETMADQYVPLPEYEEGDTYVYSDGSWEQVVVADNERVEWQNHYGNRSVGFPDFTYKRSEWQTNTRVGLRSFAQTSYLFDKPTTTLWPLTLKSKTRYDEKGKWIGKDGIERVYDSFWRCDVEGQERVKVAAGEFDTWRICCSRFRDSYSFPKSRAREYKTWYYAPSVGHWVLRTRDNRSLKPDTRKELVAIIPDLQKITRTPQALVQVQHQFQEVMEETAVGQSDLWIAAGGDSVITMIPGPVYADENGIICRQYNQEVQVAELTRRYPGIGCRTPDGTWYIPRR